MNGKKNKVWIDCNLHCCIERFTLCKSAMTCKLYVFSVTNIFVIILYLTYVLVLFLSIYHFKFYISFIFFSIWKKHFFATPKGIFNATLYWYIFVTVFHALEIIVYFSHSIKSYFYIKDIYAICILHYICMCLVDDLHQYSTL